MRIMVGEPVQVADLMEAARDESWSENQLHMAITDRVGQVRRHPYPTLVVRSGLPRAAMRIRQLSLKLCAFCTDTP